MGLNYFRNKPIPDDIFASLDNLIAVFTKIRDTNLLTELTFRDYFPNIPSGIAKFSQMQRTHSLNGFSSNEIHLSLFRAQLYPVLLTAATVMDTARGKAAFDAIYKVTDDIPYFKTNRLMTVKKTFEELHGNTQEKRDPKLLTFDVLDLACFMIAPKTDTSERALTKESANPELVQYLSRLRKQKGALIADAVTTLVHSYYPHFADAFGPGTSFDYVKLVFEQRKFPAYDLYLQSK